MNVYDVITDKIICQLEKGTIPWHRPWNAKTGRPKNLISNKDYKGCNFFMTASQGYISPFWLSFDQAKNKGGYIRKDEKGTPIIYYKLREVEDKETGEIKTYPMLRYSTVFNSEQCENVEAPVFEKPEYTHEPIKTCEDLIVKMQPHLPTIKHGEARAYYNHRDYINMPAKDIFESVPEYYSTLYHEIIHSTGHESRLARKGFNDGTHHRGSTDYSKEELIAEMGSMFLCGYAEIENHVIENGTAYIQGWLKKLKNDNKLVIQAASQAQKACDYLIG